MDNRKEQEHYLETEQMGKELVAALKCIEMYQRFIFTPQMATQLDQLDKVRSRLKERIRDHSPISTSEENGSLYETLRLSIEQVIEASDLLLQPPDSNFQQLIMRVMRGFRITCRVLEDLFPFHQELSHLNHYLLEPGNEIHGPVVIEAPSTTLFVPTGRSIHMDEYRVIWMSGG